MLFIVAVNRIELGRNRNFERIHGNNIVLYRSYVSMLQEMSARNGGQV